MSVHEVQQLFYDGKRLFCPAHPKHELEQATMQTENGLFAMICTAQVEGGGACSNSASWESRKLMEAELAGLD